MTSSADQVTFNKRDVVDTLMDNPSVHVSFIKVSDGTLREMNCTLNLDHLNRLVNESDRHREQLLFESIDQDASSQVRVFDLDKAEWRSFVIENLVSIEVN